MKFRNRLGKHAMIIHIHNTYAIRADQCRLGFLHDFEQLFLQNSSCLGFFAKAGRYHNKGFDLFFFGKYFNHSRAGSGGNRENGQLHLRYIPRVFEVFYSLNIAFPFLVYGVEFSPIFAFDQVTHNTTTRLVYIV